MDFSVILISSNSSEVSVGTSTARVILFGTIPTTIPPTTPTTDLPAIHDDTLLTPTISLTIPTIPPVAPIIQYTSLFINTGSSNNDTPDSPPLQDPYEAIVAWPSRKRCRSPTSSVHTVLSIPIGTDDRDVVETAAKEEVESRERERWIRNIPTATHTRMTQDAINELISKRVDKALKVYDDARNPRIEAESKNDQQDDHVEENVNNWNGNENGNGNPNVNNRGVVPVAPEYIRRKPLEFQVGDKVMLKVSPWKRVILFGKRRKLNPRYIRPFKILTKVETVAYRLELPEQLSRVHSKFYVSNLKKCPSDKTISISLDEIQVDNKLHFIEEPVKIMGREVKCLKQNRISIVKVLWNSRKGHEFTWEREDQMKKKYPHLFANFTPVAEVTS
nr:putative reverse transcriptase domain-containing protein [Tanacetum cinerariifolium]